MSGTEFLGRRITVEIDRQTASVNPCQCKLADSNSPIVFCYSIFVLFMHNFV